MGAGPEEDWQEGSHRARQSGRFWSPAVGMENVWGKGRRWGWATCQVRKGSQLSGESGASGPRRVAETYDSSPREARRLPAGRCSVGPGSAAPTSAGLSLDVLPGSCVWRRKADRKGPGPKAHPARIFLLRRVPGEGRRASGRASELPPSWSGRGDSFPRPRGGRVRVLLQWLIYSGC